MIDEARLPFGEVRDRGGRLADAGTGLYRPYGVLFVVT